MATVRPGCCRDAVGRNRKQKVTGSFVSHPLEMRRSPAWLVTPDHARRVLDRLEVEHMEHAGAMNGELPCTYADFEANGVPRKAIALALRQLEALGFIEVMSRGRISRAEFRRPSLYRLTYVYGRAGKGIAGPTNEWKRWATATDAQAALASAAAGRSEEHVRRSLAAVSAQASVMAPAAAKRAPIP